MNTGSIDIRPVDLATVRRILNAVLPPETVVWAFGSRANWATRDSSDLDLAVDAGRPLTRLEETSLSEQFEESDLPYRVDVVDWQRISPSFQQAIGQERVLLPKIKDETEQRTTGETKALAQNGWLYQPAYPEHWKRRAIAYILGTLDDKIELNRRMSETLEDMARALFKSWFVDFEPVRAKMAGRWREGESLPGFPAHLYDLFPTRLVDSELGEIPEGWGVQTVGENLAELVSGARPKGGAVDEGIPSVAAENVVGLGRYDFSKEKFVPHEFFRQLKSKGADVRSRDVLLYKDGAQIGRKTFFDRGFPHPECAINEHVFILRCANSWMQRYLFFWLDLPWVTSEIIALNSNPAQPGINQAGVRQLPMLRPSDEVVETFDRFVALLIDAVFEQCLESRTLAALRDTLLPKLISGKLWVLTNGDLGSKGMRA